MLLQTNSYVVPKENRVEHARLLKRFRQVLERIGCERFEIYEQVGSNWSAGETTGRFVQIMHFRDRQHQLAVQTAERTDPAAQELISEFCELINFPYQQQQGLFAVGFYRSILPFTSQRGLADASNPEQADMELVDTDAEIEETGESADTGDLLSNDSEAMDELPAEDDEPAIMGAEKDDVPPSHPA